MANLPFVLPADHVVVRRSADFGPCVVANGPLVAPGELWHMPEEEANARSDWDIVEAGPPVKAAKLEAVTPGA